MIPDPICADLQLRGDFLGGQERIGNLKEQCQRQELSHAALMTSSE